MSVQSTDQETSRRRELHEKLARRLLQNLSVDDEKDGEPESMLAESCMKDAVDARATDIHLDPYSGQYRVRFRIDGVIADVAQISQSDGLQLVNQFRTLAHLDPAGGFGPDDGRFTYALDQLNVDARVTGAPCIAGEKLAIRLLAPERVLEDVSDLGLDEQETGYLEGWLDGVGGMLVVAGPTGSGKTTTLYTLLHQLKMTTSQVLTLEDPVEYEIEGINQMPVNAEHGLDFADGARAMLRMDPDYLVIGELTQVESAQAAVNAAAGGRATMTTVHSRDAVDAITVLRNFGLDDFEISSNIQIVVAQRLVRRLCEHCREKQEIGSRDRRWLESLKMEVPGKIWAPQGCEKCHDMGFKGRIGIFEVWRPTDEEYGMILDHGGAHEIRRALAGRSHKFLLDDGLAKADAGLVWLGDLRSLAALSASAAQGHSALVSG